MARCEGTKNDGKPCWYDASAKREFQGAMYNVCGHHDKETFQPAALRDFGEMSLRQAKIDAQKFMLRLFTWMEHHYEISIDEVVIVREGGEIRDIRISARI